MKKQNGALIVFGINLLYCFIVGYKIAPDTVTYEDPVGPLRTVGYPLLLNVIRDYNILMIVNCALGACMFYMVRDMIGRGAWLMLALGTFTIYTPWVLTDLLFATIFIAAIWQVRNLWAHFILLGVASLIRPSLAWFFMIEPLVLYCYGYRGAILFLSAPITFVVTGFTPMNNYIQHGIWTHSTVLQHNLESESFFGGRESTLRYFIKAIKLNCLSPHYYKPLVILYTAIWLRFGLRILQRRINLAYVIMVGYFIGPSLVGAAGPRIRLPIEWMLLV